MPAWLWQALKMLGVGAAGGMGWEAGTGLMEGPVRSNGAQGYGWSVVDQVIGGDRKKRRRRRRALTASDRADIGFIVGLLGPAAGKQFSTVLAARPR